MSQRGRPDLSPTQLVAGGLATATATVATSYLGVAGTIIGAAFMSIATTAGAVIYQYYIDRGKRRYTSVVNSEIRHRFVDRAAEPAELKESAPPAPDDGADTRAKPAEEKVKVAAGPPRRRPRWYVLAGAAFAIFAVVLGTITAIESLTNKPVSAMLGRSDRSGTSLGETFGGDGGPAPIRHQVVPSSTAPASPTGTAPATPPDDPSGPATAPIPSPPASPSGTATTRPPAPTPTTPTTRPTAP